MRRGCVAPEFAHAPSCIEPVSSLVPASVSENPSGPAPGPQPIPARISEDGRTATWNPGMTYAAQVLVRVHLAGGIIEERRSMNSGRARVREGETIEAILANERL